MSRMTDTTPSRENALDALDDAGRARARADAAVKKAAKQQEDAVVAGYKAGISVAEMHRRVGLSESYIRSIRRDHELPAHPSYADLTPPVRGGRKRAVEPAAHQPTPEPEAEEADIASLGERVASLPSARLIVLLDAVEGTAAHRSRFPRLAVITEAEAWHDAAVELVTAALDELGPKRWPGAARDLADTGR